MEDYKLRHIDHRPIYIGMNNFIDDDFSSSTSELFSQYYAGMRDIGAHPYELDRISSAIYYVRALLKRKGLSGSDKTALEIGSGKGMKSIALADLFGRYIGIDINGSDLLEAERRNAKFGNRPIDFICGNAATVIENSGSHGIPHKIDVLILYAVLEHLTLEEREVIIKLADDVMLSGGKVLVMEVPNRLTPFDSHTLNGHFFNWLPDKFANELARSSAKQPEIKEMLRPWHESGAQTQLARAGRGVSYHDFSAALSNPFQSYSYVADGFDVEMLNMEPFDYQQFQLYGYLIANVPDINAPSFGRKWLDFIMERRTGFENGKAKIFISPHWPNWTSFEKPPLFWQPVAVILSAYNPSWVCQMKGAPTSEITLLFGAPEKKGKLFVYLNNEKLADIDVEVLVKSKPVTWHNDHSVSISVSTRVHELRIEIDTSDGPILFQGCVLTGPSEVVSA